MFPDAQSAIKWAEAYAAKSNVQSQIARLLAKGGGEPVWDIALTISSKVAQLEPAERALSLKCIYGGPDMERDQILGEVIADYLIKRKLDFEKPKDQLLKLGHATVKAERALTVYGDRYPLKRMAHDVGISREQFCTAPKWLEVRAEAIEALRNWAEAGIRDMESWLSEHRWLNETVDG